MLIHPLTATEKLFMKSSKTILVIEDDPFIRESIQDVLALEGYQIQTAPNGTLGIHLALESLPDLILCDVAMPEMDGYAVLSALQQHPATATTPFIFLTARTTRADLRYGMNLGADDYLVKPCSAIELIEAITTRFERQSAIRRRSETQLKSLRDNISHLLPHELYTPLNGILGFSEVLFRESETIERAEIKEFAESIHTSALRLHRLMQNFLLYSRLELLTHNPDQQQLLQSQVTQDPHKILKDSAHDTAESLKRSDDLQLQQSEPADLALRMTESHFYKLVEELLGNAFKFSEPGQFVKVNSSLRAGQFELTVVNQGRGMTPEQIADLGAYMQFERKSYEQQGAGLGLIIVRRIVDLYRGGFQISSQPNETTRIEVLLPIAEDEPS